MIKDTKRDYRLTARELGGLLKLPMSSLRVMTEKFSGFSPINLQEKIPYSVIREILIKLGVSFDDKRVSFVNLKGGVGKTTLTVTLAVRAVQFGFRVAVIDMDPQASASVAFQCEPEDNDPIFLDIWKKPESLMFPALRTIDESFVMLPSSLDNSLLDSSLASPVHQKTAVSKVCDILTGRGYDLILIDCPPSLGTAVVSSICASDTLVIPVTNDPFSLKGLELTLREVSSIREAFGLSQPDIRILFNRYDRRERMTDVAWKTVMANHGKELHAEPIPTSTLFSRALNKSSTLFDLPETHPAKEAYDSFFHSLVGISLKEIQKKAHNEFKRSRKKD